MTFLGLKQGLDLEYRAAHPHQDFPEAPPPPPGRGVVHKIYEKAPDMSIAETVVNKVYCTCPILNL